MNRSTVRPGEGIRLPKDNPAAGEVVPHDRLAVFPGIAQAALPKGFVKAVVCIGREKPDPDLGVAVEKAGAQVPPAWADDVHQCAVVASGFALHQFGVVNPRMAGFDAVFCLAGDFHPRIGTLLFHNALHF